MEKISNNFNNRYNESNSLNKKININQSQNYDKKINNYILFKNDKNIITNNKKFLDDNKAKKSIVSKSQDNNRLSKIGNNIININKINFPIKSIPLKIHNSKENNNINIITHKLEENLRYNNININQMINSGNKYNNNLYKFNNSNNIKKFNPSLDLNKNIQYHKSYYIFGKGQKSKRPKENNINHMGNKFKNSYYNINRFKNKNQNNNINSIQNDLHINLMNNKLEEIKEKRRIVHKKKDILLKMYNDEEIKIEEEEKINREEEIKEEERRKKEKDRKRRLGEDNKKKKQDELNKFNVGNSLNGFRFSNNNNISNHSTNKIINANHNIANSHNNQNYRKMKNNISYNTNNTNNSNNSLNYYDLNYNPFRNNNYSNINSNEIINSIIDEDENINFENLDNFMNEVDNILNEYNHIRVEIENLINNLNEKNKNKVGPIDKKLLDKLIIKKIEDIDQLHEESKKCIICLEDFINNDIVIYLPCFHVFHKICLIKWIKRHATCPLCKLNINEVLK